MLTDRELNAGHQIGLRNSRRQSKLGEVQAKTTRSNPQIFEKSVLLLFCSCKIRHRPFHNHFSYRFYRKCSFVLKLISLMII